MDKSLTLNDAQEKINNRKLDFVILEYKPNGQKSKFKHSCGYVFETRLSHLLSRNRCPVCNGKWRTKEMFQIESNRIHNNEYQILDFKSGNDLVKINHKSCGNIFKQIGYRHLRGDRCFECYGNKKLSKSDIIKRSNDLWNNEYEFLSDEVIYSDKSLIRHKKCGYEYNQIVSSHLLGMGCPKCAGNAPLTKSIIQERSDKIHKSEYEILSDPNGYLSKIEILHKKCGDVFNQVVADHLSGCGCKKCNQSKMENFIENLLLENNILYTKQKTFEGCKYKNKLKFDFYLPEYKTCVEFDGIQHFKPIRFFGGVKNFELQKIKDEIKNRYCLNNGIKLLRLNYLQDIEEIKKQINMLL